MLDFDLYLKRKAQLLTLLEPHTKDGVAKVDNMEIYINRCDQGFYQEGTLTMYRKGCGVSVSIIESWNYMFECKEKVFVDVSSTHDYIFASPLIGNIDVNSTIDFWVNTIARKLSVTELYFHEQDNVWKSEYSTILIPHQILSEFCENAKLLGVHCEMPEFHDLGNQDGYGNHWDSLDILMVNTQYDLDSDFSKFNIEWENTSKKIATVLADLNKNASLIS